MDLTGYQYVVLRYVPRVEREEFVNVGVVLYCQAADFLAAQYRLDVTRLRVLDPDVDPAGVHDVLETVARVCRGDSGGGLPHLDGLGKRFGWICAPRSTVLQPGPVHGGLTTDPPAELDRLLGCLVS